MRHLLLIMGIALIAAACGESSPAGDGSPEPTRPPATTREEELTTTTGGPESTVETPPPVVVRGADTDVVLTLEAWTACWGNGCFDGMPPSDLVDMGDPSEILVEFPASGWTFDATVTLVNEECGRRQTEPLDRVGPTTHRLVPIGRAGEYEVTLFGRGPGGDLFVSFLWSTPTDGIMPVPTATASILADHDGDVDSYGVEVPVWNLAATPETAVAEATVTSAEGASHHFALTPQDHDCSEGSLYFTAPTDEGLAAAGLGTAPFTYEITLQLDEGTHVGTGVWPNDVDPECSPCVPLSFTPPLPALDAEHTAGIQAVQIDDVWVFHHDPAGWGEALHSGIAEIENGCLYVDDAVVVWHVDQLDQARRVIADVKAGDQPDLRIGGGGISRNEGASAEDLPGVITTRCATETVWFGAPPE